MTGHVRLEVRGPIAVITNDHVEKHNAFDDQMDAQLFEILADLRSRSDIRAVVWRGAGKSFSSGRDVGSIGTNISGLSHHELMRRGHRGILAMACDIRIAAEGSRFMLPEVGHGVIPDTGGVARLYEICGPGVVSDLVLTGRVLTAEEALGHGIVSRVVPADELDATAIEMAEKIAAAPAVTVKLSRMVIGHLSHGTVRTSMDDELIYQTFLNRSDDFAEFRSARSEDRPANYTGS